MDFINVIAVVVDVLLIAVILFFSSREKIRAFFSKKNGKSSQEDNFKHAENLLKSIGCTYTREKRKDDLVEFRFNFQNGYYNMRIFPHSGEVVIFFQGIAEVSAEKIDLLRVICNRVNTIVLCHTVYYAYSDDKKNMIVHISAPFFFTDDTLRTKDAFLTLLEGFFDVRRLFTNEFLLLEKEGSSSSPYDVEKNNLNYARENALLDSLELFHIVDGERVKNTANESFNFRSGAKQPISVASLLATVFQINQPSIIDITIVSDSIKTLSSAEQVKTFNVLSSLIAEEEEGKPSFVKDVVTLLVKYKYQTKENDSLRIATIVLKADKETQECLYVVAAVADVNAEAGAFEVPGVLKSSSFYLAYDKGDNEQRLKELAYMRQDAIDKIFAGKQEELTEDQQMLALWQTDDFAQKVYWGRKCFRQERYYEVIAYLAPVWNKMLAYELPKDEAIQNTLFLTAFYLGSSYAELKLYDQAYYYLDGIFHIRDIGVSIAYVNTLVNARDFRSLYVINTLIKELREKYTDGAEPMTDVEERFMNFLRRRWAYVHVELGDLTSAENVYKKMLNEPLNADFALNELAYIQKLRENNSILLPDDGPEKSLKDLDI